MSVYRPGTIKRVRRTKDQIEQLDRQILDVLRADHPQSVRHVFYRMTDPRLPEPVEKSDTGYRHVQYRITELRRAGRLPYGWIADATRRGYFVNTFSNASDFIRSMAGTYRADIWREAECYLEVWTESRSIASVIVDDCEDLAVSLYPAGGFSSISLAFQAAENINHETGNGRKPCVVLYVGDYDPAGVLIDKSIERELREHLHANVALSFQRIGITEEQIKDYDLPTKPRKEGDRRSQELKYTVEAEAMPAGLLRQLLRDEIELHMPPQALYAAKLAEQSEREHLMRMAALLDGGA